MSVSDLAEFERLLKPGERLLKPGESELSFEDLGNATQRLVELLQDELFPESAVKIAKLQSIWARHPTRLGEKLLFNH